MKNDGGEAACRWFYAWIIGHARLYDSRARSSIGSHVLLSKKEASKRVPWANCPTKARTTCSHLAARVSAKDLRRTVAERRHCKDIGSGRTIRRAVPSVYV